MECKNIDASDAIVAILAETTRHRYKFRSKLAKTLAKKLKFPKNICTVCVYITIRNFCSSIEAYIDYLFYEREVFILNF